ncbi:conjugative coupling factor TraD, PFGI-1 class, partial [Xanthomonas hortorum pv. cynarae]|nr:conjugative coupling factor TraD, PFGI-1 class [Xanthomonas hortorum pv. cynarae]
LWKIRMPLPAPALDEVMPQDLQQLAGYMRQTYTDATQWWEYTSSSVMQDAALPGDLLDEVVTAVRVANAGAIDDTGNEASP